MFQTTNKILSSRKVAFRRFGECNRQTHKTPEFVARWEEREANKAGRGENPSENNPLVQRKTSHADPLRSVEDRARYKRLLVGKDLTFSREDLCAAIQFVFSFFSLSFHLSWNCKREEDLSTICMDL